MPRSTRRRFLASAGAAGAAATLAPLSSLYAGSRAITRAPSSGLLAGVDASFLPQYDAAGVGFFDGSGSVPRDALLIYASRGVNLLRLRVWNNPTSGWCNLTRTLAMASRAKQLGMKVLLDFHYSDTWADPGMQTPPALWQGLSLAVLAQRVHDFTLTALLAHKAQGTSVDFVQVGNEVTDGMLWPLGRISSSGWGGFVAVLNAGLAACGDASLGASKPRTIVHIDRGGDFGASNWFFGNLAQRGVAFDALGLSYYPWWHGTLGAFEQNVTQLAGVFGKPILLAETAYPWTLAWQDGTNNFVGLPSQLVPGYPATPEGQASFVRRLGEVMAALPGGRGMGVCYWAPEYAAAGGISSPWENLTLCNFARHALPGVGALGAISIRS